MNRMLALVEQYGPTTGRVLDVGSRRVKPEHATFRDLFNDYVGIDIVHGDNVDVVVRELEAFPKSLGYFDLVVSGNCLEHSRRPWRTVEFASRAMRPGARMVLIAPFHWEVHECPRDLWRFTGKGLAELCHLAGCLSVIDCGQDDPDERHHADAWCVAEKV